MTSPGNLYRRHLKHGDDVKGEVQPCVDGGEKCARGCGATLKTSLDRFTHYCDMQGTSKAALRGDRRSRSACA
jgi:hypothetical protein